MTTLADFRADTLAGKDTDLSEYFGQVVLVVNTASKCGFTPQFEGLQKLYDDYRDQGLIVLGFPCGQFKDQEFTTADEIGDFCSANYGVTFPMFAKVDVNGKHQHPLFRWLKREKHDALGKAIKWNFTKFLVGHDGRVIARYAPTYEPSLIGVDIARAIADNTTAP